MPREKNTGIFTHEDQSTYYLSTFLKYLLEEESIIHGSRKYTFKSLCFRRGWCHLESLCEMRVVTKCSLHEGAHLGWICRPGCESKPRRKCSRIPAAEPMPCEGEEVLRGHLGVYEPWAHICVIKTKRQTERKPWISQRKMNRSSSQEGDHGAFHIQSRKAIYIFMTM